MMAIIQTRSHCPQLERTTHHGHQRISRARHRRQPRDRQGDRRGTARPRRQRRSTPRCATRPRSPTIGSMPIALDVTDAGSVAAAAEQASDVEIVVNNAGIGRPSNPLQATLDDARAELETNYLGLVSVTNAFAPVLAANGGGAFVNMLSVVSWVAMPHLATYSASKAAAWAYSNAVRTQLATQGTEVVGVHVGYVDTDLTAELEGDKIAPSLVAVSALDALAAGAPEAIVDEFSRTIKAGLADDQNLIYPGIREQFAGASRLTDEHASQSSAQRTGGGCPSALALSDGSHWHTAQPWANADRANRTASPWGSSAVRTSAQSRTYSPSAGSQRAAAGSSTPSSETVGRGVRVGVEGGAVIALVTGPPADRNLLGIHRVAHDEVLRRRFCGTAGEQVDGEIERSPPRVDRRRAAAIGRAEGGQRQRRLRGRGEVGFDCDRIVGGVLLVLVERDAPADLLRRGVDLHLARDPVAARPATHDRRRRPNARRRARSVARCRRCPRRSPRGCADRARRRPSRTGREPAAGSSPSRARSGAARRVGARAREGRAPPPTCPAPACGRAACRTSYARRRRRGRATVEVMALTLPQNRSTPWAIGVGDEQPADQSRQRRSVRRRQPLQQRRDVRLEPGRHLGRRALARHRSARPAPPADRRSTGPA